jgi:hypothetical protein
MPDFDGWLDELSKRTGASVEESDRERLRNTNPDDPNNPDNNDTTRLMQAYESQYAERGRSGQTGSGTDSSERTAQGYGSGRGETADDRAPAASVAKSWLSPGMPGSGGGQASYGQGSPVNSLFPDWYRELLTRQQQQMETQQAETKARGDALYGQLNQRATQGLAVDRNDPIIRQQADAFSANAERSKREYLADTAERAGPLGNILGEQRLASEKYGQMTGEFEAQLVGRELTARREEISDALHMSAGLLSGEQTRNLQQQLAMLDQAIAEAGVGLSARGQDLDFQLGNRGLDVSMRGQDMGMDQFLRDLALREWDRGQYWDYNWAGL